MQAVCWDRPACKALCAKYSLNEVYSKSDYALLDILVQESPLQSSLFSLLKKQLGGKVAARDLRKAFHLSLATWEASGLSMISLRMFNERSSLRDALV